jgi:hypothetical protein
MSPLLTPPGCCSADGAIELSDFYYVSDVDQFLYVPTGALWTAQAVNGRLPSIKTSKKNNGKYVYVKPADWLRLYRAVEQQTWAPGEPEIIEDRLVTDGGWRAKPGTHAFNLYRPPTLVHGDAALATPWLDHLNTIYPEDSEDIINWLAHRVQRPDQKPNHALVLGGPQGIGKDMILQPVKMAVGPWNFQEISPSNLLEPYNPFVRAVVLRMNEAHDLGEGERNRFMLYERVKTYAAAPPDVLGCTDKYIRRHYVPNVLGLIITTNHKTDGVYLPADDRRHFVAWSDHAKEEFTTQYWNEMWTWLLQEGGNKHVAAYLAQHNLSAFNACALPRQTAAFFDIVSANQAPEDSDLADALDDLGQPEICSLMSIATSPRGATMEWLLDKRQLRSFPHRLGRCGYVFCRNPEDTDRGRWRINGRRQTLYVKARLAPEQRLRAAREFVLRADKPAGSS